MFIASCAVILSPYSSNNTSISSTSLWNVLPPLGRRCFLLRGEGGGGGSSYSGTHCQNNERHSHGVVCVRTHGRTRGAPARPVRTSCPGRPRARPVQHARVKGGRIGGRKGAISIFGSAVAPVPPTCVPVAADPGRCTCSGSGPCKSRASGSRPCTARPCRVRTRHRPRQRPQRQQAKGWHSCFP